MYRVKLKDGYMRVYEGILLTGNKLEAAIFPTKEEACKFMEANCSWSKSYDISEETEETKEDLRQKVQIDASAEERRAFVQLDRSSRRVCKDTKVIGGDVSMTRAEEPVYTVQVGCCTRCPLIIVEEGKLKCQELGEVVESGGVVDSRCPYRQLSSTIKILLDIQDYDW